MMRFCDISFVFLSIVLSTQYMLSVWDLIALRFWKILLNYCIDDFLFPSIFSSLSFRTHIYILSFLLPSAPLSTPLFISSLSHLILDLSAKGLWRQMGLGAGGLPTEYYLLSPLSPLSVRCFAQLCWVVPGS